MADITPDECRGLAKVAGLRLLEEDVEPLTLQFNALREGLEVLDEHDLYGVAPLPALQYPEEAPGLPSPAAARRPLPEGEVEGTGAGPSTGSGGSTGSPDDTDFINRSPSVTSATSAPPIGLSSGVGTA
ncbi:MAG: hypothetical protein OXO53_05605 [Chloroflexota bacterium]|nr:hypothetical protein [Chloroflexota bacterium]